LPGFLLPFWQVALHGLPFVRWLLLGSCRVFYCPFLASGTARAAVYEVASVGKLAGFLLFRRKMRGSDFDLALFHYGANERGRRFHRPTPSPSRRIKESGAPARTVNDILLSFITIDAFFGSGRMDIRRIFRQRRRV
jgi:hypothetical protein